MNNIQRTAHVTIGYTEYTVSEGTVAKLLEIVEGGRACNMCHQLFNNSDRYAVTLNACKACVMGTHQVADYIGGFDDTRHEFIDDKGDILTCDARYKGLPERDMIRTLNHYGFIVPTDNRHQHNYYIYSGDKTRDKWLLVKYSDQHGGGWDSGKGAFVPLEVYYLCNKDGSYTELNKRRGDWQKLMREARDLIPDDGSRWIQRTREDKAIELLNQRADDYTVADFQ